MALIENTPVNHHKAAMALDLFAKLWCRVEDSEDLKFRCKGCPMELQDKTCAAKLWKKQNAPYYRDFGSMGEL